MSKYTPINIKAIVVATNYNFFSGENYINTIREKQLDKMYELIPQETSIRIQGEQPFNINNIPNLSSLMPIIFRDSKSGVEINYINPEQKIMIRKLDFSKNSFELFKNISTNFLDLKLSEINAIGINYSADFNLGNAKLQLLNTNIENEIPDFKHNLTFEFVLPIKYKNRDLVANYRIKKIQGGDNTSNPRIYNVSVNFHFDISKLTTKDKYGKLENILNVNMFDEFLDKCQGFLKLNDGR